MELQIGRLGTFVVTFRSRTDEFQMTPNGGLYHSRLNRNLSVRFPKKAVDTTVSFILEVGHTTINFTIRQQLYLKVGHTIISFTLEVGDTTIIFTFT